MPSYLNNPGPKPPMKTADSLTKAYISAYEAKDAAGYLSLFSDEADYFDFAVQVHAKVKLLREELQRSFRRQEFQLSFHLSFVSQDGRFAALQGTYRDTTRGGDPASIPIASILEFREGEVVREALYYDGSLFKRHLHAA